uniref:Uncharacterized protein n=1 Tax=Cuerna arida TaxID=1464854 RepID=A0A1B6FA88_9HEMI
MSTVASKLINKENYEHPLYISPNGSWKIIKSLYLDEKMSAFTNISAIFNHYNKPQHAHLNFNMLFKVDEYFNNKIREEHESNKLCSTVVDTFHKDFEQFITNYESVKNNRSVISSQSIPDEVECAFHPGTITSFIFLDSDKHENSNQFDYNLVDGQKSSIIVDSFHKAFEQFLASYEYHKYFVFTHSLVVPETQNWLPVVTSTSSKQTDYTILKNSHNSYDNGIGQTLCSKSNESCEINMLYNGSENTTFYQSEETVKPDVDTNYKYTIQQYKINNYSNKIESVPKNSIDSIALGSEFDSEVINTFLKQDRISQNTSKYLKRTKCKTLNSLKNCLKHDHLLLTSKVKCNSISTGSRSIKYILSVRKTKICKSNTKTKYTIWDLTPRNMPKDKLLKSILKEDPNFSMHRPDCNK